MQAGSKPEMQLRRVRLLNQAASDLKAIWFSISQLNPVSADQFVVRVMDRIDELSTMPERMPLHPEIAPDVRMFVEGKYLVLFRVIGDEVAVVRVVFGAMDLTKLDLDG